MLHWKEYYSDKCGPKKNIKQICPFSLWDNPNTLHSKLYLVSELWSKINDSDSERIIL